MGIFDTVICGVDASDESLEAARQAAQLLAPGGRLLLVAVAELEVAAQAGFAATVVAQELEQEAREALDRAGREVASLRASAETRLLSGPVPATLLGETNEQDATLLVLGTHGHGRASGILLARASTSLLHDASCAVLVARSPRGERPFPSRIVCGLDGSPESEAAVAAARDLAKRLGSSIRLVVAEGGRSVDTSAIRRAYPEVEVADGKPVDVLVAASAEAELLVLGSRGVHGLRALGSVSERVGHHAQCSVLVVR